jgi:hypothetical protein
MAPSRIARKYAHSRGVRVKREQLDVLVAQAGLTMAEFADLAGVSSVTLSYARNGRPVRTSTLSKIALALMKLKPHKALDGLVTASAPDDEHAA